jgi:hypothetical protein
LFTAVVVVDTLLVKLFEGDKEIKAVNLVKDICNILAMPFWVIGIYNY